MEKNGKTRSVPSYGRGFEGVSGLVAPGSFERWYSPNNRLGQTLAFGRGH